jgi:hypothetical protein
MVLFFAGRRAGEGELLFADIHHRGRLGRGEDGVKWRDLPIFGRVWRSTGALAGDRALRSGSAAESGARAEPVLGRQGWEVNPPVKVFPDCGPQAMIRPARWSE